MILKNKLQHMILFMFSLLLLVNVTVGVKFVTLDINNFSLDSKLFSEINDTADCEKYLELIPPEGTQFGDILMGDKKIVRPSKIDNRRVMVCLAGPQVNQIYVKSFRILDDSDKEEKLYVYTRTDRPPNPNLRH